MKFELGHLSCMSVPIMEECQSSKRTKYVDWVAECIDLGQPMIRTKYVDSVAESIFLGTQ